jgi:hypothetical protein
MRLAFYLLSTFERRRIRYPYPSLVATAVEVGEVCGCAYLGSKQVRLAALRLALDGWSLFTGAHTPFSYEKNTSSKLSQNRSVRLHSEVVLL